MTTGTIELLLKLGGYPIGNVRQISILGLLSIITSSGKDTFRIYKRMLKIAHVEFAEATMELKTTLQSLFVIRI